MFKNLLAEAFFFATFTLCAVVPSLLNTNNLLQGSVIPPTLQYPGNSSAASGNTSFSSNSLRVRCDPVRYGRNLRVESCRKAFNYLRAGGTETIFADRSSTLPHDLSLPLRYTGSKSLSAAVLSLLHMTRSSSGMVSVFSMKLIVANR